MCNATIARFLQALASSKTAHSISIHFISFHKSSRYILRVSKQNQLARYMRRDRERKKKKEEKEKEQDSFIKQQQQPESQL